jgi:hypothetical protein
MPMLALDPNVQIPTASKSSWTGLDEKTVMNRIDELKHDANAIEQGSLGLCGEAAFFHHVLQLQPALFGSMAKSLFMTGWGFLKDITIHPRPGLLNNNYLTIRAADRSIPSQADWMVLSALCDSSNYVLGFTGEAHEEIASMTFPDTLMSWYEKCGLYKSVSVDGWGVDLIGLGLGTNLATYLANVVKTERTHITMLIRRVMLLPGTNPLILHYITLESAFSFNQSDSTVTFRYWSWGETIKEKTLSWTDFRTTYLGAFIANF